MHFSEISLNRKLKKGIGEKRIQYIASISGEGWSLFSIFNVILFEETISVALYSYR